MSQPARKGVLAAAVVAAIATLGPAVPAASSAASFGANLSRPADNTTTCNDPGWFVYYTFNSCSFNSQDLTTGENAFPPAGQGVVTAVRVKVGPTTGPMQIVVEQALRKDNPGDPGHPTYACCQAINASQVFTPNANAITQIPVNLPVRQDLTPDPSTGYYVDQHLSLSVLAPNVPIPASIDSNAYYGGHFPAWQVGDERADTYGGQGAMILFNADWSQSSNAGPGGGAVTIGNRATVKGNKVGIPITCQLDATCSGLLQLLGQGALAAAKGKVPLYGSISFSVPAHKTATVTVKLNSAGRKLLRKRRSARVAAKVTVGGATSGSAVTLKRSKR